MKPPAEMHTIADGWTVRTAQGWVTVAPRACGSGTLNGGQNLVMMDGHAKHEGRNPERVVFQEADGVWSATYFALER